MGFPRRDPLDLLGDANRLLRDQLRAGREVDVPEFFRQRPRLKTRSSTDRRILAWLKHYPDKGFEPLQEVLADAPGAIAHPVVVHLLQRLAHLIPTNPPRDFAPLDTLPGDDDRSFRARVRSLEACPRLGAGLVRLLECLRGVRHPALLAASPRAPRPQ